MANCKRLIEQGLLDNPTPVNIIKTGYQELLEHKESLFGKIPDGQNNVNILILF